MNSSFSRVRGTRGYMVPEWISNLPITSKVDVNSYGVVVMEMVTGKSPMTTGGQVSGNTGEKEQRGLVNPDFSVKVRNVINLALEWTLACDRDQSHCGNQTVLVGRVPPPVGLFKLNTDGSFEANLSMGLACGLIPDSSGNWVLGFQRKDVVASSSTAVECWVLKDCLQLALERNLIGILAETDSLTLKQKSAMSIYREGNRNADAIAKANLSSSDNNLFVIQSISNYLIQIILDDARGRTISSDGLEFKASDFGIGVWRRLRMDADGNVRLYSLDEGKRIWRVSWQAISQPCKIHGVCGPNAMCNYDYPGENSGRRCSCLPGYKAKNFIDWSLGCEPEFTLSCNATESSFIKLPNVEFYGYDINSYDNYTLERCEEVCLQNCKCTGFIFPYRSESGFYSCYPKSRLLNGSRSPAFGAPFYVRLPKASLTSYANRKQEIGLHCPPTTQNLLLDRAYKKPKENGTLQFMVWFASAFGGFEIICICFVWLLLYKTQQSSSENAQGYLQVVSRFRKFSYDELKKATGKFREEIGRGGSGVVYKGILSDRRVAAIKRLNEAKQGEEELLAELSTIGTVNHMNLIEIWGYCVEGNHRLLVYEYMERGSLAENLIFGTLDWVKRFDIAIGSAKGLAYLHEEYCLEWVLHCDVKPQNILLDSNFQPKVADFGLSKLLNRGGCGKSLSFSRVRGTRGYMAPEWISNLPITSKVDVYSYGMVVLEMVTGKSPMTTGVQGSRNTGEMEQRGLVKWVREKMNGNGENELWLEEIIDPIMKGKCDLRKMGILVQVALECVEEDKNARPTMSQVIERLLPHEKG
ncbi:hypothetical protein RHGRI_016360 [Rhododendron griersonianum]|uniref:non-specific serine/threonine protein kinase n=1 Tax=Rhododendron griersonianum TaxID=479676 RepID=A0AAV6JTV5_9ERIC|nr:hypothetical protein RHGRI_016360 [Rhododendron griersonianum]